MVYGILVHSKPATKTRAKKLDRHFMAAFARALSRPMPVEMVNEHLTAKSKELDESFAERVRYEIAMKDRDGEKWRKLQEACGKKLFYDDAGLMRAVKFVLDSNLLSSYDGIEKLLTEMDEARARVDKAFKDMTK